MSLLLQYLDRGDFSAKAFARLREELAPGLTHEKIARKAAEHGAKYIYRPGDPVPRIADRARFKRPCGHTSEQAVGNVINTGVGCNRCAGRGRTNEELARLVADKGGLTLVFDDPDAPAPSVDLVTEFACTTAGHRVFMTANNALNGKGCGKCLGRDRTNAELAALIEKHGKLRLIFKDPEGDSPKTQERPGFVCIAAGHMNAKTTVHNALKGQGCATCWENRRTAGLRRHIGRPVIDGSGRVFETRAAAERTVRVQIGVALRRGGGYLAGGLTWRYLTAEEIEQWHAAGCPEKMEFKRKAA